MRYFKNIDISGLNFTFRFNGNKTYKTCLGGFFTVSIIITFISLFYIMGENMYENKNPTATFSSFKPIDYFNYTVNNSNFIFTFRLEDNNGETVDRPDLFYFEPQYVVYHRMDQGLVLVAKDILKYGRCTKENVNNSSFYDKLYLHNYYCLDWNNTNNNNNNNNQSLRSLTLGGMYDGQLIQYIKIKVSSCFKAPQKYLANNNITCNDNITELHQVFDNNLLFGVFLQEYNFEADNYEDPFRVEMLNLYDTLDLHVYKKSYSYFKKGTMYDSKDWLRETPEYKEIYGVDRLHFDFYTSRKEPFNSSFYETNLYFDKITEKYYRKYMKFQELLACVFGIIKTITLSFGIFYSIYNEYYIYRYMINQCFDINEDLGINKLKTLKTLRPPKQVKKALLNLYFNKKGINKINNSFTNNNESMRENPSNSQNSNNLRECSRDTTPKHNNDLIKLKCNIQNLQDIQDLSQIRFRPSRRSSRLIPKANVSKTILNDISNPEYLGGVNSSRLKSKDNVTNLINKAPNSSYYGVIPNSLNPQVNPYYNYTVQINLNKSEIDIEKEKSLNVEMKGKFSSKKVKLSLSFCENFRLIFCRLSKEKREEKIFYNMALKYINEHFDFVAILKHHFQTKKAFKFLLNNEQLDEIKKNPILNFQTLKIDH